MNTHFTHDNTDGQYSAAQLAAMNAQLDILVDGDFDDLNHVKNMADIVTSNPDAAYAMCHGKAESLLRRTAQRDEDGVFCECHIFGELGSRRIDRPVSYPELADIIDGYARGDY